jgi:site-specific DNA-methyltransferase (adenine-specific)
MNELENINESSLDALNQPLHKADVVRSAVFNEDCMLVMKRYPDKFFNLAIVDPPYGLGKKLKPRGGMIGKYNSFADMGEESWDAEPPTKEYFEELFRVSKNQIVWGGNYFIDKLYPTQCFLVWDKQNGSNPMSDCELAWTSFQNKVARLYSGHIFSGIGCTNYKPIHPTQKPIKLYEWILMQCANEGDLILDTHLGSGSSRIAAHKLKYSFVGCEIDKKYFDKQEARFKNFISQQTLW